MDKTEISLTGTFVIFAIVGLVFALLTVLCLRLVFHVLGYLLICSFFALIFHF